ncbi:substrate-binding domain-containing protein [Roseobacter sp.]|uniref:PstS family phosphate ABC transporter substrate-binding protein n=1 Tax=Roseobacter sp. TaxID=1907202 RepID=UPI003299205C
MLKKCRAAMLGAIVSSLLVGTEGMAQADTLRIGGTGVALGGMTLLGAAFEQQNPGVTVDVLPSLGSSGGVKALVAGAIDLSLSARALKEAEVETGVKARLYATTSLVIVTSSQTNADAISTEDLARMYAGEVVQWPSGQPVRPVLRPKSETDTKVLKNLSDSVARAIDQAYERPGAVVASTDQENADLLEQLEGSLGAVALGQIATEKRRLKRLAVEGAASKPAGGTGLFDKTLFVVMPSNPRPLAAQFYDFIFSQEAQTILAAHDYLPAR